MKTSALNESKYTQDEFSTATSESKRERVLFGMTDSKLRLLYIQKDIRRLLNDSSYYRKTDWGRSAISDRISSVILTHKTARIVQLSEGQLTVPPFVKSKRERVLFGMTDSKLRLLS